MRKNKKIIILGICVLACILMAFIGGQTYAKYMANVQGKGTADVANWSFKVNDKDEKIQTISLNTTINNKTLVNSKIAPGTQGNFQIKLDGTDSEVGINYNIRFENETNKPRNLKFQYNGETYNSLNELQKILEGNIEANEENKIKTLDIKWIWPYETGTTVEEIAKNDKIDTEDSKNIKTYDFDVIVKGIQINPGE